MILSPKLAHTINPPTIKVHLKTRMEGEGGTVGCDDVGNLNDWIDRSFREYSRSSSTLDIKTENPQGGNFSTFSLRCMRHDISIRDLTFDLTIGNFIDALADLVFPRRQLDPIHTNDLRKISIHSFTNHKPENVVPNKREIKTEGQERYGGDMTD